MGKLSSGKKVLPIGGQARLPTPMMPLGIGGQAVLEGVMLRAKKNWVVSIRKPNREIASHARRNLNLTEKVWFLKWPILRGFVVLIETLIIGVQALSISAQEASEEEVKITGKEMAFSFFLALAIAIGLFVILPVWLTKTVDKYLVSTFTLNLVEGSLRIALFLAYLLGVSRVKDIARVFEYHGAEHKVVHAYENEEKLTPEVASKYSPQHVACGTSFLLLVMVIAIFVFSFLGRPSLPLRIVSRIVVIPLVAGISYEIIKLARRYQKFWLTKVVMAPGLLLQKMTTRQPSSDQLEVALCSLKKLLALEKAKK